MPATKTALALLCLTTALAGCSTITKGGSQTVDVVVKGSPKAYCEFTTSVFRNIGHFPNKVTLERSAEPLHVACRGEQNRYIEFEVESATATTRTTLGNTLSGILPGALYDVGTGASYYYPDPLIVDFRTVGAAPKPAWPHDQTIDQTTVGTADIAKPQPVRMSPVLDEVIDPSIGTAAIAKPTPIQTGPVVTTPASIAVQQASTTPLVATTGMQPIASPEDEMGADPAAVKAKIAAEAKAKAEAIKANAAAKARLKAAAEAKAKAAAEAAKAEAEKIDSGALQDTVELLPEATMDDAPKADDELVEPTTQDVPTKTLDSVVDTISATAADELKETITETTEDALSDTEQ